MRYLWIFLLTLTASAQVVVLGPTVAVGKGVFGAAGTIAPPPPAGLPASFFAGSHNKMPPALWPPKDTTGATLAFTSERLWDDGVKLDQMFTCNGTTCTSYGPFSGILKTFMNTNVPAFPVDVLYVFGDTPSGAAQGTGSGCATPTSGTNPGGNQSSCAPFTDSDANQATCNATPNSGGTQDATVIANCGNGTNMQFKTMVWKILSTYPGITKVECWNEPDGANNFWANDAKFGGLGSKPTRKNQPPLVRLAAMCNIVLKIAHALNPNIQVYTPSFHGPTALNWFDYFAHTSFNDSGCTGSCSSAIGGITWPAANNVSAQATWDIPNFHGRGGSGGNGEGGGNQDPVAFLGAYANALTELTSIGLPNLLVDDEWGPVNKNGCQTPTGDYLGYYVAVGLAVRASVSIVQEYYYQLDATAGGGTCQNAQSPSGIVTSGTPTIGSLNWDTMANWLTGSAVGPTLNPTGQNYSIAIVNSSTVTEKIVWNEAPLTQALGAVTVSGGNTIYACSGCAALNGEYITITGYSAAGNNTSATVTSASSSSITTNNPSGVAAPSGSGSGSYVPVTCGTNCPTQSAAGFGHWVDLTGASHVISGGVAPVGAKPVLLTP